MIRFASDNDIPVLKELWATCFGDPRSYVDFYFSNGFHTADTLVDMEQGAPVAMLALLPCAYETLRCGYVYAAATHPKYRRQGRMERLLAFAKAEAERRGYMAVLLCPADEALFGYYAKFGYTTILSHRICSVSIDAPCEETISNCPTTEYSVQRDALQSLSLCTPYDHYALQEAAYSGTMFLRGNRFYAAVQQREDMLFVRELLVSEGEAPRAVNALATALKRQQIELRLPLDSPVLAEHTSRTVPYAALLPLGNHDWTSMYTNLLLTED